MSTLLLVVDRPEHWSHELPGVQVLTARDYLTDLEWSTRRNAKVFNLCRSYRYQSAGYYVSLLAEARGHRVLPSVDTIRDLRSKAIVRVVSDDLDAMVQRSLARVTSDSFTLSIYFGRNLAQRHQRLARELFNLFPAPLLRAQFARTEDGWQLTGLRLIPFREVPDTHREFAVAAAREHFASRQGRPTARKNAMRYDLAILHNPDAGDLAPSNPRALKRFVRAAAQVGLRAELITRDDFGRLAEFDALFLRETTRVEDHTYRFARRAAVEGLVVIDDPRSILRCTNKVYLAELLHRSKVPTPATVVVHRDTVDEALQRIGLPAVLKLPDSAFSLAVAKVEDHESFRLRAREYLETSDLLIAQEFFPTDFDWRIGILDREVLFAARYGMARGHWQIARHDGHGHTRYGSVEAVALEEVDPKILDIALQAANLIGDGFYGVDLKVRGDRMAVIEINDNPNLDAGCEDAILGDELYRRVMRVFLQRIESLKTGGDRT